MKITKKHFSIFLLIIASSRLLHAGVSSQHDPKEAPIESSPEAVGSFEQDNQEETTNEITTPEQDTTQLIENAAPQEKKITRQKKNLRKKRKTR